MLWNGLTHQLGKVQLRVLLLMFQSRVGAFYVGLIGNRVKHIVIAQNSFRYSNGFFDLDYTAIPIGWALGVHVLVKAHVPGEVANQIVNSLWLGVTGRLGIRDGLRVEFFR